ncbi:MAG: hypothetical protein QXL96_06865 [Ignisphaera sp.]
MVRKNKKELSNCRFECSTLYKTCLKLYPNKEKECYETYEECLKECEEEEEEEWE